MESSVENIKKIAEGLFPKENIELREDGRVFITKMMMGLFNPYESWNDCGIVLEAIQKEIQAQGLYLIFDSHGNILMHDPCKRDGGKFLHSFSKDGICKAYLSTLGEDNG